MKKVRVAPKGDLIFNVGTECQLHQFLTEKFAGKSRSALKSLLAHRRVSVNGSVTTAYDYALRVGDKVAINRGRAAAGLHHPMLRSVFEDQHIIVVDKRNGLLSMGTDKQRDKTAYSILSHHVKLEDPANRIFIVHRLDRDTSGVMIFAKRQRIQELLQRNWNDAVIERKYMAVVEGCVEPQEGEVKSYLKENAAMQVYSTQNPEEGQLAITRYKTVAGNGRFSLLEVQLETGRKNQIRVHMHDLGHPIIGDRKYGSECNPIGRVALHAASLRFKHPITGQMLHFESNLPEKFEYIVKEK